MGIPSEGPGTIRRLGHSVTPAHLGCPARRLGRQGVATVPGNRLTGLMKLTALARAPIALGHPVQGLKHVRATTDGTIVVDMRPPWLVWENDRYPWYFTAPDRVAGELRPVGPGGKSLSLGVCDEFDLVLPGGRVLQRALRRYPDAASDIVKDCFTFRWEAFDDWFEEDEVVRGHPRDPYTRVDVLASSRHVVARVRDTVVADSRRPVIAFETGLAPRFFLPRVDIRTDLLQPTDTVSESPYSGTARHWAVRVGDLVLPDAVLSYERPLPEVGRIAGLMAFRPEGAPELHLSVDGQPFGPIG